MEQITRTYGKFLLDAAVVISLFGMILVWLTDDTGNRGFFHIAGAHLVAQGIEEHVPKEFSTYQVECTKSPPVISFAEAGMIRKGCHAMSEYVEAMDYNGRELPIRLLGCCDSDGQELENFNMETGEVYFEKAGIYTVKISAVDGENRKSICSIRLAVND